MYVQYLTEFYSLRACMINGYGVKHFFKVDRYTYCEFIVAYTHSAEASFSTFYSTRQSKIQIKI